MKTLFTIIIASFIAGAVSAQTTDTVSYLKAEQWKINANLIGGSLTYEKKMNRSSTLYMDAGAAYNVSYSYSSTRGSDHRYAFSPYVSIEGRNYYHFKERIAKGKSTANNASNFWFLQASYVFKPISHTAGYTYSDAISIMPGWGIQRNLRQHFSLELQLGLDVSYYPQSSEWYVGPGGQFKIGYLIK